MTDKAHAYLWFPQDMLLSRRVSKLSAQEECWYRRGLDYAWLEDGLPNDPSEVADCIGKECTPAAAKKILELFFVADKKDPSKMRNLKQENLRKKFRAKISKLRKAGKASAAKRAANKDLGAENGGNKCSTNAEQMSSNPTQPNPTQFKEEKDSPIGESKKKLGRRIPEPFMLTQSMRAWHGSKCPQVDVATETEKFVNHFRAKAGQDATALDWEARWRNWMLNARDRYGVNRNGTSSTNNGKGGKRSDAEILRASAEQLNRDYGEDPA